MRYSFCLSLIMCYFTYFPINYSCPNRKQARRKRSSPFFLIRLIRQFKFQLYLIKAVGTNVFHLWHKLKFALHPSFRFISLLLLMVIVLHNVTHTQKHKNSDKRVYYILPFLQTVLFTIYESLTKNHCAVIVQKKII